VEYLLDRPELAASAALVMALLALGTAFSRTLRPMGDPVTERLTALSKGGVGDPTTVPPANRYAGAEQRDYSGDRGTVPTPPRSDVVRVGSLVAPAWRDLYAETCDRLGLRPLAG
jgi:hypothetical protein